MILYIIGRSTPIVHVRFISEKDSPVKTLKKYFLNQGCFYSETFIKCCRCIYLASMKRYFAYMPIVWGNSFIITWTKKNKYALYEKRRLICNYLRPNSLFDKSWDCFQQECETDVHFIPYYLVFEIWSAFMMMYWWKKEENSMLCKMYKNASTF